MQSSKVTTIMITATTITMGITTGITHTITAISTLATVLRASKFRACPKNA